MEVGRDAYIKAQDRTAWILRYGKIDEWLEGPESEVLVVNGQDAAPSRDSAVSIFSSMLTQALVNGKAGRVLFWSCSQNFTSAATDLIQDLIGQLLDKMEGKLHQELVEELSRSMLESVDKQLKLCALLLKEQLRHLPVFIVVDSISFYEDRARSADTRKLVNRLHKLAGKVNGPHMLKVMVSSPTRCQYFGTFLDDNSPTVLK